MTSSNLSIVVDTREQEPYSFDSQGVTVVRKALPAGDYSLVGSETTFAIERKSLADFVTSLIHDRARFLRELRLLATYDFASIVVEGSLEDLVAHRYRSGASPLAILGTAYSIIIDFGVPIFFCCDRQLARRFVEGLLVRYNLKVQR